MPTILAVDDAKFIQAVIQSDLEENGYKVITADCGTQALSILSEQKIDLILLDLYMPDITGLEVLHLLKCQPDNMNIPVIMLSGSDKEQQIVDALDIGAVDYITKPYVLEIFLARIRTSLRLQEKTRLLEKVAATDFLTNLNNRRHFSTLVKQALSKSHRNKRALVLAMMDIDHFKQVNDNYGHDGGDQVLVAFANFMKKAFREYDVIGRLGGEEFAICMPETTLQEGINCCERFRQKLADMMINIDNDGHHDAIHITTSIGLIASDPSDDALDYDTLLRCADEALYAAKHDGRNKLVSHRLQA